MTTYNKVCLWKCLFLRSSEVQVRREVMLLDTVCQKKAKNRIHLQLSVWILCVSACACVVLF